MARVGDDEHHSVAEAVTVQVGVDRVLADLLEFLAELE
jgi:hypothetical protein